MEGFVGQSRGRRRGVLRSSGQKMLRGLTYRLDDCDARGNGGEGAAGGHCGLTFKDVHSSGVMLVQMLCSAA